MINKIALCLSLILVSSISCASLASEREDILVAKVYQSSGGKKLPYRLFIPENYDRQKKYPLVLYLHGGGGLGTDNLQQISGGNSFLIGMFTKAENQAKFPCFVVAPQSHDEGWVKGSDHRTPGKQLKLVFELLESLQMNYSIDHERLYVAGQSLGGFGTFAIINERPDLFAAAVPLCGGGDESKAGRIAHVALWAFHGEKDEAVPVERSRQMIAAIKRAKGQPKYTEYSGEGHTIWTKVATEPELLPWMFAQRRIR